MLRNVLAHVMENKKKKKKLSIELALSRTRNAFTGCSTNAAAALLHRQACALPSDLSCCCACVCVCVCVLPVWIQESEELSRWDTSTLLPRAFVLFQFLHHRTNLSLHVNLKIKEDINHYN